MEESKVNRVKWFLGIIILVLFVFNSLEILNQDTTLGLFLLIGLGLGYIESRSEVGISSGYVDFFVTGSRTRLYGLLLLFSIGSLAAIIIHAYAASNGAVPQYRATSETAIPGTSAVSPINFGLVLGAFLFGVGLTLNKGCGMGTLRNIGLGQGRHVLTLIFLLIGTLPGQWLKYTLDQSPLHNYSIQLYFPDLLGYAGTFILGLGLFALLVFIAIQYEKERRKEGTYKDVPDYNLPDLKDSKDTPLLLRMFKENWARLTSIVLITLLLIGALVFTGNKLAVTQPLLYPAVDLVQKLGFNLDSSVFKEPLQVVGNGIFNHHIVLQNAGIVVGALVFGLTSMQFSFSWDASLKESVWYALSGLLMGIGAVLASGCIVGALYSGVVNLSLSGWVVFASMSAGIWLTVKIMNGKISTIPSIE
jgi:hypothetical protein